MPLFLDYLEAEMKELKITTLNSITVVAGAPASGKTTYLIGVAHRLSEAFNKNVVWVGNNYEVPHFISNEISTIECMSKSKLKQILQQLSNCTVIIDDFHLFRSLDRTGQETIQEVFSDVDKSIEVFCSVQTRTG
jgi:tRNA uridine 5-carbamoylmethylation protein Kti12